MAADTQTTLNGPASAPAAEAGAGEPATFDCPRCSKQVTERFWGPCTACREELVASLRRETSGDDGDLADGGRFEPSMNVVPNHVATKD